MSALCFFTEEIFSTGDLVCIDQFGQACQYDSYDPEGPIIGVAICPKDGFNPNGRQWFAVNGPVFYLNDFYVYQEDLMSDFTEENTGFQPFNPFDSGYVTAITQGIGAVKKNQLGIPSNWIKLREGLNYDWWYIR